MCKITHTRKTADLPITKKGYKVVVIDNKGNYFSPWTGIQYEENKPITPVPLNTSLKEKRLCENVNSETLISRRTKEKRMYGLTSIFENKTDARRLTFLLAGKGSEKIGYKIKIVEMVLSGIRYKGTAIGNYPVYIGSIIKSIREI